MKDADDYLLNASDFASIKIEVGFRNLTSGAPALGPEVVSLQEISDDSLVLGLPKNSCASRHSVELDIQREDPAGKPIKFHATGKITSIELTDEPGMIRAEIELQQFDERSWRQLLKACGARQDAINRFLAAAKG